uniref:PNPLA domain-containing protein n=1 Tax=viral metagenome TaxID=1070528 RepID=A0A6C0BD80_9ZZZZ
MTTKLRIILSGGGVKGIFQIGVLSEIFNDSKFEVDRVYGCSVGAIMSPFVANKDLKPLIKLFSDVKSVTDIFEPHTFLGIQITNKFFISMFAFFNNGAYKKVKIIDKTWSLLSKEQIEIANKKCYVVAYDILNDNEEWFTDDELYNGIKYSSALWLAVPPIKSKDGKSLYSDGGTVDLFPVDYILNNELKDNFDGLYLFIDCDTRMRQKNSHPTNAIEMMSKLHDAALSRLSESELLDLSTALKDKFLIIKPDINHLSNALDIDSLRMKNAFDHGVSKGKEFLEKYNN